MPNKSYDYYIFTTGVIGELTAAKSQKEVQVQKLTDELSDVSRKLKVLQDEKNKLLSQSSNDAQQKSLEVQALEKVGVICIFRSLVGKCLSSGINCVVLEDRKENRISFTSRSSLDHCLRPKGGYIRSKSWKQSITVSL